MTNEVVVELETQDDKPGDAKEDDEEKKLMEEWSKYMSDFVPEDMISVSIIGKKNEVTSNTFKIFNNLDIL